MNHLKFLSKLQHPIMIGHTIIIISIILLTLLTSFWYIFIIIYALFDIYLLWQLKHNHIENDLKNKHVRSYDVRAFTCLFLLINFFFSATTFSIGAFKLEASTIYFGLCFTS